MAGAPVILDTWSDAERFGKDKVRGVVTIDVLSAHPSPLIRSGGPRARIVELSQVATQVLTSSQGCGEFFSEYATGVMIQHEMELDELE